MKIRLTNYFLFSVPFDAKVSWGSLGYSRHVIIELEGDNGKKGTGEGVLYRTTHWELLPYLENVVIPYFEKENFTNQENCLALCSRKFTRFEPAVAFALDTGIRQVSSKQKSSIVEMKADTEQFFLDDKNLAIKITAMIKRGTRFVKLKGGQKPSEDINNIRHINMLTAKKLAIKLDLNRGYNLREALELASWASSNNVILFEEPVRADFATTSRFRRQSAMPVMLDESIQTLGDLRAAIAAKAIDVLNLKLTRVGGQTSALEYAKICKEKKIAVSIGCNEELDIGMAENFRLAEKLESVYGFEGYGPERLGFSIGNPFDSRKLYQAAKKNGFRIYRKGDQSKSFLATEAVNVWKNRLHNVFNQFTK